MPAPSTGVPTTNSRWRVDVDLDTANYAGNWAQLRGMSQFTPAVSDTIQDATDYDTDGWGSDARTQRKHNGNGTVMRKQYAGSFDPAQEALRKAADDNLLLHVRWYERIVGGEAYEGYALVQWDPQGGDAPGLGTVNFTLLGQGPRVPITNPFATAALPTVNALSPKTGPAAGGTNVVITGSGFTGLTGATAVQFGTTNATEYVVVSDSKIVAKAPAGTGTKQVKVTNTNGASIDTVADDFLYV